ncbi:MAG TPA: 2OG-Fe(II) oxygenase [Terricaulis sp.]|nr:2OG-Fe(II) oxygenase [Terricaulis sp.]
MNALPQIDAADQILLGDADAPPRPQEAAALYDAAFAAGDAVGAHRLALMAAQGVGRQPDWNEALDWLSRAALLGDVAAREQLAIFAGEPAGDEREIRRARERIDLQALLTPPPVRTLRESPRLGVIEGFASPAIARWMIARAERLLEPGLVYDARSGEARADEARTAKSACLDFLNRDLVTAVLQERIARVLRLPAPHHEPPNVIAYNPGEQFAPHFDFIAPDVPARRAEVEVRGQRVATCLTYLSDDFDGGETFFVDLDFRFRGAVGDCLIFFNVGPDRLPDRRTLHAGLPPTRGRKWLLSQWLRDKMLPLM